MLIVLISVLFFIVLFLLISMASHVFIAAPFVLTPPVVMQTMIATAKLQPGQTVVDLGCGDGRLLIAAKKSQPTIKAIGYELVPAACVQAWLRSLMQRVHITVYWRSMYKADLAEAQVVFTYLWPSAMRKLEPLFSRHMQTGSTLISQTFRLPTKEPVQTLRVPIGSKERVLFVYKW